MSVHKEALERRETRCSMRGNVPMTPLTAKAQCQTQVSSFCDVLLLASAMARGTRPQEPGARGRTDTSCGISAGRGLWVRLWYLATGRKSGELS